MLGLIDRTAVAEITLASGSSGQVENIQVDGVYITIGTIPFNNTLEQTAKDVAFNINQHVTIPNYRATSLGTKVVISADDPGTAANNRTLVSAYTGVIITPNSTTLTGGTAHLVGEFQPGRFAYTAEEKLHTLNKSIVNFSHLISRFRR